MAHLNVNPAELLRAAAEYTDLQARAAAITPRALAEVERIAATHGAIGFPAASGILTGLAPRQAAVDTKAAHFGQYGQRFTEHAATFTAQDHQAAQSYIAPAGMFDIAESPIDLGPLPEGRVICTSINASGFACSEFLSGGMVFRWLSPVDLSGHWPD